jgi:acyl carrier protein
MREGDLVGQSSSIEDRITDGSGAHANAAHRPRAALTAAAVAAVADLLQVPADTIAATAPFTDLGLSSAQLARLSAVLEDALGMEVSLTALYDHPDIEQLTEHLAAP